MQAPVWKGRAERLTTEDFSAVAAASGIEAAALRAIWEVEAANKPFRTDGSVERRFEPHHFPALANQGWNWKRSLKVTAKDREAMFVAAYAAQPEQALRATSFGGPQIMGFNAEAAGYLSATDMVRDFAKSERAQLDAMIRLARSWGLIAALRAHDWLTFARRWNGNGQPGEYARRIEAAYRKHSGKASPEVLTVGARGEAVVRLQKALGLPQDGAFGPATLAAVQAWQAANGLPADGIVGARTWAALETAAGVVPVKQETPADIALGTVEKVAGIATVASGAVEAVRRSLPEAIFGYAAIAMITVGAIYALVWLARRARKWA